MGPPGGGAAPGFSPGVAGGISPWGVVAQAVRTRPRINTTANETIIDIGFLFLIISAFLHVKIVMVGWPS
jgi:hypothetical protein